MEFIIVEIVDTVSSIYNTYYFQYTDNEVEIARFCSAIRRIRFNPDIGWISIYTNKISASAAAEHTGVIPMLKGKFRFPVTQDECKLPTLASLIYKRMMPPIPPREFFHTSQPLYTCREVS